MNSNHLHLRADYEIRDPGLERAKALLAGELEWRGHLWTANLTDGQSAAGGGDASSISASRRRLDSLLCAARLRLRAVQQSARRRARRRAAIRELGRLPDRLLADIGVPRERIVDFVDGTLAKEQAQVPRRAAALATETRRTHTPPLPTRAAA